MTDSSSQAAGGCMDVVNPPPPPTVQLVGCTARWKCCYRRKRIPAPTPATAASTTALSGLSCEALTNGTRLALTGQTDVCCVASIGLVASRSGDHERVIAHRFSGSSALGNCAFAEHGPGFNQDSLNLVTMQSWQAFVMQKFARLALVC